MEEGAVLSDIMAKRLATFYPYSKNQKEAKFEDNKLIHLVKEISRQDSIQVGTEEAAVTERYEPLRRSHLWPWNDKKVFF